MALYIRELDFLVRSLRRLGISARDIDDVLQETFMVMMRRWKDYDPARPVRPWLFGIAFRVATAHRRRSSRESLGAELEIEDLALRPDEALAAAERRTLLLRALEAVPLARRTVLIMHDVHEMTMRDIAEELSIGLFAGYTRLRKARRELETALKTLREGETMLATTEGESLAR